MATAIWRWLSLTRTERPSLAASIRYTRIRLSVRPAVPLLNRVGSSEALRSSAMRQSHAGCSVNPAVAVKLPRAGKPEKTFLTHEQVTALADAAGKPKVTTADLPPSPEALRLAGERRTIILVLSYCGLRWGELAALKVGRVDTMRRRITISESVTEVAGTLTWGTPKTHQQRSVPIPRFLIDELDVLKAGKGPNDLLFTGARGGVLRNMNFRRAVFDDAAKSVGLKGLTPHELRHTAASLAVSSRANVKAVQRMLGHASAAMTLDVYSGLFDDDLDGVADRMDKAHVYSLCTAPEVGSVVPESNVSQIRSATTESA
jgi:integrase